jgi:hypothetical protein
LFIAAALGIGLWLGRQPHQPSAYEIERTAMDLELSRTMLPFRVAFRIVFISLLLLILAGIGWGIIRWLHRRAGTVYPDHSGLYPIREERVGGAKVFHDPNRAFAGSTVYATSGRNIDVSHAMPAGQASAQQQITAQAQATQALRAAVSGSAPLPSADRFPADLLSTRRTSPPLPEVRTLELEPSHVERLLLEDADPRI